MLKIRDQQMVVLQDLQRQTFGDATLAFIRERYPQACASFSEADLRGMVALALRKAREHGITAHADILRYINVMFTLGCDFEADPDYPWAQEIMNTPRLKPASKINQLTARTLRHLQTLEKA
jgi:hypothetical protein